jgi:hypothetical protein
MTALDERPALLGEQQCERDDCGSLAVRDGLCGRHWLPSDPQRREGLLGREEPRLWTRNLRPLTRANTHGWEAITFAETVLGFDLLPWQKWWLLHALELKQDGSYRFRTIVTLVGRQQGKTTLLKIVALWAMYLDRVHLVLGAAQSLDIARESWKGALDLARGNELLANELTRVTTGSIETAMTLTNGARYRITAATPGSGRGLSVDLLILDELREQRDWEAWSALSKDLPNSTPILRADGEWSTMGELTIGDRIFAPSGKPATVTAVHPVAELRPMYRVTTTDGRSLIASESHLWTVRDDRESHDPTRAWKTLTTGRILAEGLRYKAAGSIRWRMPVQHALVDLPERALPIDPYVLGAWLGDGTSADGTLTTGIGDLEAQCSALEGAGALVTSRVETRPGTWRVRMHVGGRPLRVALRECGLLGSKHVPNGYLTASVEQRLALLAGMLDTDGSVTAGGDVSFTNKNGDLARAVQFLARSLGWNARLSSFVPKIDGRACGIAWRVTFCLRDGDLIPFRLPRKATRWTPRANSLRGTGIASIEPVETEPSTCIAVDSDDHLFLAGRDLVPTHNTTIARPNALTVAISNAGDDKSVVLNSLRSTGLAETDESIALFEWSAPDGCALDDPDAWCQAMPGLGHGTITESAVRLALATDPESVFRTELLCQSVDALNPALDPHGWAACADRGLDIAPIAQRAVMCLDVSPDGEHVSMVTAAMRDDGKIAIVESGGWSDTTSARQALAEMLPRIRPRALGWYPSGPAAVLGAELAKLNADQRGPIGRMTVDRKSFREWAPGLVELRGDDVKEACQTLADLVKARKIVHAGTALLNSHATGAQRLDQGDGWRFTRRGAGHVDAMYAAAGAVHLARTIKPYAPPPKSAVW